jgi:hypothetical protein
VPRCASSMTAPQLCLLRRHHPWGRSPRRGLRQGLEAKNSKAPTGVMGNTLPPVDLCGHRRAGPPVSSNVDAANVLLHRHQTAPRREGETSGRRSHAERSGGAAARRPREGGDGGTGIRHLWLFFFGRTRSQR